MPDLILTDDHRYFIGYREYASVTAVLRAEGFMPMFDRPWYLERGKMIHSATELWDKGILDEATIDPRITGYLESWKKFKIGRGEYPAEAIEIKLYDDVYGDAGTLDRWDCDIKTGAPEPWHIFQIGEYYRLVGIHMKLNKNVCFPVKPNKNVYLQEDGSYPIIRTYAPSKLIEAGQTFLCALNVYPAKKRAGV